MIPPSAVKKFLDRKLDDNRWLKDLSEAEIDEQLDSLKYPPQYWHKLMRHQKVCLYLGIVHEGYAFWCDMGSGKTLISLELLQYWWDLGRLRRALVFVTSDKAFSTWERQVVQYGIKLPYVSLNADSSDVKWRLLDNFGDGIVFLHYPGTVAMVSEKIRSKGKNKLALSPEKVERLLDRVDALVLDESTKASNKSSLTYELCHEAAKVAQFRYALAGMPFGRDPMILWPQMKLIDDGQTLGTLGLFREAFFTKKQNYWGGPYSFDYTFKPSMKDRLSEVLQHRSITYTAAECIDLPDVIPVVETVKLPPEIMEFYDQVVNEIMGAKHNFRVVKNAFLRMRQLSSGFLGLTDDETGDKAQMDFDQNPKLDRLIELIDELPEGSKAIVFYEYTHSGRRIVEALKKELDIDAVWLWSGIKNPSQKLEVFMRDKDSPIAVINNRVGAYSLDGLQVANYEFHFESALSVIDRAQAEKRIVRQGQTRKCFIYDLVADGTVDAKILQFHKEGSDLFQALLAHPEQVLK